MDIRFENSDFEFAVKSDAQGITVTTNMLADCDDTDASDYKAGADMMAAFVLSYAVEGGDVRSTLFQKALTRAIEIFTTKLSPENRTIYRLSTAEIG